MRRLLVLFSVVLFAAPIAVRADACAGLVAPGGTVRLLRTTTLAAHHDGVEHYVTSFTFQGTGEEFGSIVPLPGVPTSIERGGDWTLQRLEREKPPPPQAASAGGATAAGTSDGATVVEQKRIDALDITILEGGGDAVGRWATEHGFQLTPDAPEVLDFYAARSPYFMAARFDAGAAEERGQQSGDGTPVHLTIPLADPWVPLRVLGLGKQPSEFIGADVFLLTDQEPALLPPESRPGTIVGRSDRASQSLLDDLRADKGMEWVPSSMHLTYLSIGASNEQLRYDLAIDASGAGQPSWAAAGLTEPAPPPPATEPAPPPTTIPPESEPPATVPPDSAPVTTEPPATSAPTTAAVTAATLAAAATRQPTAAATALSSWSLIILLFRTRRLP